MSTQTDGAPFEAYSDRTLALLAYGAGAVYFVGMAVFVVMFFRNDTLLLSTGILLAALGGPVLTAFLKSLYGI